MKKIRKTHILVFLLFLFCFTHLHITSSFASEKHLVHSYTALNKLKKSLIADEEYTKAVEFLQEFVDNHPDTYFAQMASIEIADIYFKYLKDNYKALEYYISVIKKTDNMDLKRTILDKVSKVQKAITAMELDLLEIHLDDYYIKHLRYPKRLEHLPQKNKNMLTDSWGQPYYYQTTAVDFLPGMSNQKYILFSTGRDKLEGTLDDIVPTSTKQKTTRKIKTDSKYPFRVKNTFQSDGTLKGVISSSLKMKKYKTVKEGDKVDGHLILGIKPEGIIIYTIDKEPLFIPIRE